MLCPKCKTEPLEPKTAFDSWSAHEPHVCDTCRGMWLPGPALARLVDAHLDMLDLPPPSGGTAGLQDLIPGVCPEGHGELARLKIELEPPFFLDRCPHCKGVWFDGGEWQRLASSHLLDHLDELWVSSWQKRLRRIETRDSLLAWGNERFGPALAALLDEVAEGLATKGLKAEGLAYLCELSRSDEDAPR